MIPSDRRLYNDNRANRTFFEEMHGSDWECRSEIQRIVDQHFSISFLIKSCAFLMFLMTVINGSPLLLTKPKPEKKAHD
jgi:hypothetical protein